MQLNRGDCRTPLNTFELQHNVPSLLVIYDYECVNILLLLSSRFPLAGLRSSMSRFQPSDASLNFMTRICL